VAGKGRGSGEVSAWGWKVDAGYVSTLRRFIEAMGGELEIVARFLDHAVKIRNFAELNAK
jgi:hypothetical protein